MRKAKHTKTRTLLAIGLAAALMIFGGSAAHADASRTTYPVVFAHGLSGFDDIFGFDYWGDDFGTFVGDPCGWFELSCNGDIDSKQQAMAAAVQPFQSSEVRGVQLADAVEGYMAATGASRINIVGHSQGGLDARKAAYVLQARKGYPVVKVLASVSTPHRGSTTANAILDLGTATEVLNFLVSVFGTIIYAPGNDGFAAAKQLVHEDYDPNDGITTGTEAYNNAYPNSSAVAERYVSLITAQRGLDVNPLLNLLKILHDIDGDDDGLVAITSQHNGWRLQYSECFLCFDRINTYGALGYVSHPNYPNSSQRGSKAAVIDQDHIDVIGVGPDTFDEKEFYAALLHYIAYYD